MLREIMETFRVLSRRMTVLDREDFQDFIQQKLRRELELAPLRRGDRPPSDHRGSLPPSDRFPPRSSRREVGR